MIKYRHIPLYKCDVAGIGTAAAGAAQAGASFYAAERQYDAAIATNETNKQLAEERNNLEYQMFGEANEFNAEQAQLSREHAMQMQKDAQEYNSITSQMQRARAAHINPAAVLGQSTSVGVNSSSAQAQSVAPPNMVAAQMQTPDLSALQGMAQAFANIGSTMESFAKAKNLNADTQQKMTYNTFQKQIIESGLKVNDSVIRQNYAAAEQMQENINLIHKKVDEVQAKITLMGKQGNLLDEQTFAQNVENAFKSKEMELHIKNLQAIFECNENQARWMAETFAARVFGVHLQNQKTIEEIGLTHVQQGYFNNLTDLVETQNTQAAFDFQMNRMFTARERRAGIHFTEAQTGVANETKGSLEFQNNPWVRGLHEFEGVINTAANVGLTVAGGMGARAAMKRAGQVSGSQLPSNTTSYKPLPPKAGYRVIKRGSSYEYERE